MDLRIIIYLLILFQMTACGKDSAPMAEPAQEVTPQVQLKPEIPLEKMRQGECLNLEKLVQYINQKDFHFPARKTTIDLGYAWQSDLFFAYNLGYKNFQLSLFPMLKSVSQKDCTQVTIFNSYNRPLNYRIDQHTKMSLYLVREEAGTEEPLEDVKETAQLEEPEYKSIEIILESPLSLSMSYETETVFYRCQSHKKLSYKKTVRYHWGENTHSLPKQERINDSLAALINQKLSGSDNILAYTVVPTLLTLQELDNIQNKLKAEIPVNNLCASIH